MIRPAHITDLHIERGSQMSAIVQSDIVNRGISFEAAVESLAEYLEIDVEAVKLGIAIANEWGGRESDPSARLRQHNAEVQRFYAAARVAS